VTALAATVFLVQPTAGHAATTASDFVLPVWQGTSAGAAAPGHQVDCSATNAEWPYACTMSVAAVTTGANCAVESISNPASSGTGANTYRDTACVLRIEGTVYWEDLDACLFTPDLHLTNWQSGVNSTAFSATYYPLDARMVPVTTSAGAVVQNLYKLVVTSAGQSRIGGHRITMKEQFLVRFNRSSLDCPNEDTLRNLKGNVYDAAADVHLSGADGYFQDSVGIG
jgi:hypothetical protein